MYIIVILQYVNETNVKYGLSLKYTKLEAMEVGLWARTFQVTGDEERSTAAQMTVVRTTKYTTTTTCHQYPLINCQSLNRGLKRERRPVWSPSGHIAHQ